MEIICPSCQRKRKIRSHRLCSSCTESRRRYNGPRICTGCGASTYQNFSNLPKVVCRNCFHSDLEIIKSHCLLRTKLKRIEKLVRVSRRTIRLYCRYFLGEIQNPPRRSYAPETLSLLNSCRAEVMAHFQNQPQ